MSQESALAAKIAAVNNCHAYAAKLYAILAPIFATLVGQQIDKKDGTFLEKVRSRLPEFADGHSLRVYRSPSGYSLAFCVNCNQEIQGEGCYIYYETTVYIGEMANGRLVNLIDPDQKRCDYTTEEIQQKREALDAARKAYETAKSDLFPFNTPDR